MVSFIVMIDYHVHTALCNHAKGKMTAYIQSAVDKGFTEICFLDLLTIYDSGNHLSMTPGEVPFYFQAVKLLKKRYQGVIAVKAGLEIDYNSRYTDLYRHITDTFAFDAVACSLHFLKGVDIVTRNSPWKRGMPDPDEVYDLFFEELERMVAQDFFDVICHLDLVKKFGRISSSFPERDAQRYESILRTIKARELVVEVNTSGYGHAVNEPYPSMPLIGMCSDYGIPMTLGSDAHSPESVGRHYDRVLPLLRSAGCRRLTTFRRRQRDYIDI